MNMNTIYTDSVKLSEITVLTFFSNQFCFPGNNCKRINVYSFYIMFLILIMVNSIFSRKRNSFFFFYEIDEIFLALKL